MERILEILAKGQQITLDDISRIEDLMINLPAATRYEQMPAVLEGLTQIVSDFDYLGNVRLADIERLGAFAS